MGAARLPDGPTLRLLRLRSGVSQRALARALSRRPSRVGAIENSVRLSAETVTAYIGAVHGLVHERESLTLDDLAPGR